jgi:hypothetical protein
VTVASSLSPAHKYWNQGQAELWAKTHSLNNMPLTEIAISLNGLYPKNSPLKVTLAINLF